MTNSSSPTLASRNAAAHKLRRYLRISSLVLLTVGPAIFLPVDVRPQGQPQPSAAKTSPSKKHRLRITRSYFTAVTLKADKASLSEIASDLSKRLGAQVIMGPGLKKRTITVEFYDLGLEPALRLLSPRDYIDYEIRANAQTAPLAVFLLDEDDAVPAKNAVVQSSSETIMIEGNTEDTPEQPASQVVEDPLQVTLNETYLTVKSKKQPLAAVLLTVADVLGVPAEIKYESTEIVDTEIKSTPFEDAITRLSPNIRLYLRADLTRAQRIPLRLKLVPPTKGVDSALNQ